MEKKVIEVDGYSITMSALKVKENNNNVSLVKNIDNVFFIKKEEEKIGYIQIGNYFNTFQDAEKALYKIIGYKNYLFKGFEENKVRNTIKNFPKLLSVYNEKINKLVLLSFQSTKNHEKTILKYIFYIIEKDKKFNEYYSKLS